MFKISQNHVFLLISLDHLSCHASGKSSWLRSVPHVPYVPWVNAVAATRHVAANPA